MVLNSYRRQTWLFQLSHWQDRGIFFAAYVELVCPKLRHTPIELVFQGGRARTSVAEER